MSVSILENIKQSIISTSSESVWDDILENYDSELLRVVIDGDTTPFIDELAESGEDNVGLSALQISALQSAQSGGAWEIVATANTYTYFPVWAEESGGLSNNNNQWSYGNGATGVIGITVPDCEVYAMSFDAEVAGTSVSIDLMLNGGSVFTQTFNGSDEYVDFSNAPISVTQGQVLGFRTNTETGTYSDARVTAWCRIPLSGIAIKGEKGDNGQDGITTITGGTGVTLETTTKSARVTINTQSDVNNTTPVDLSINTTTLDQIGVSIASNEITLPQGTYRVTAQISVSSNVQRSNQRLDLLVGGSLFSYVLGSGYIRSTGNHNDASFHLDEIITITAGGQNIKFQSRGIATTGTVNTDASGSRILISKLA